MNGSQASTLAVSGVIDTSASPLRIGGNTIWSEWFSGLIDEVRIYNRALSAAEIQTDMNVSISAPDSQAPTAPGTLTATGGARPGQLSWGAATDNVAVARYNLHRGTSAGFTPSAANRIAQPTGTTYVDSALTPGTYYYRGHRRGRGHQRRPRFERGERHRDGRHDGADAADDAYRNPGAGQVSLAWSGATDAAGSPVTTSTAPRRRASRRAREPDRTADRHELRGPGLSGGTYDYRVIAVDPAGNESPPSPQASAAVLTGRHPGSSASGASTPASARRRRTAPVAATPARSAARPGRRPGGSGTPSPSTGSTTSSPSPTRTASTSQRDDARGVGAADRARQRLADGADEGADFGTSCIALYANGPGGKVPAARSSRATYREAGAGTQLAANTWTHVATTYNGTALTVYVNGSQAATVGDEPARSRSAPASPDRRQHDLGRVVPGRDRRGARLQPRAQHDRDPGGHEPPGHEPGLRRAVGTGHPVRDRHAHVGAADLGRSHRQRPQWSATTSTAARLPASPPRPPTASRSRPARATPIPSLPARTTTGSPPRTARPLRAPPRTRPRLRSAT